MEVPVAGVTPPAPAPDGRQGCARKALAGCGVIALLLMGVIVALLLYVRRDPTLLTDLMMKQIDSLYDTGVTEQDKAALRSAYQEFRTAVKTQRVNQEAVRRAQSTVYAHRSRRLTRDDVHDLTRIFHEGASPRTPPGSSLPQPALTR